MVKSLLKTCYVSEGCKKRQLSPRDLVGYLKSLIYSLGKFSILIPFFKSDKLVFFSFYTAQQHSIKPSCKTSQTVTKATKISLNG